MVDQTVALKESWRVGSWGSWWGVKKDNKMVVNWAASMVVWWAERMDDTQADE